MSFTPNPAASTCYCRQAMDCPLNGKCLSEDIVYKTTISAPNKPTKFYYGLTERKFKDRYNNHTLSFRSEDYRKDTELSKCVWTLKELGIEPKTKWEIIKKADRGDAICA